MKTPVIITNGIGFFQRNPILMWAIIIGIGIYIIYRFGKSKGEEKIPDLPDNIPNPNPNPPSGQDKSFNPGVLTDALAKEIIGIAWLPRDEEPFETLTILPDWQFIAVYDDWRKRYFKESGNMTLIQAIANETTGWASFSNIKKRIAKRGQELGLV
jgi:hypothetical protein